MNKIKVLWERFLDGTAIFISVMAGDYEINVEDEEEDN